MPWISKKAKAQIRARRKKKEKLSCCDGNTNNTNNNNGNNTTNTNNDNNNKNGNNNGDNHLKRKRNDNKTINNNDDNLHENWKTIHKTTVMTITIPSTLSSKEAKKIRKDARRKARKEQRDENLIKFVNEHGKEIIIIHNDDQHVEDDTTTNDDDNDNNNNNNHNNNNTTQYTQQPKKRKIQKSFPNINQLLAEAAQAKIEIEKQNKKQSYEDSIPTEIKDKYVALDCEMVGIGAEGRQSALARVSITDWYGQIVLDTFVQVPDRVTDFRTFVSGIRAKDIKMTNSNAMELHACRKKVGEILKNKILVGHSLKNDFAALMLGHPKHLIRDTARYKPFMRASGRNGGKLKPRKLRDLVKEHVGLIIQKDGEAHTSVEDAKATMELYKSVREQWEKEVEKMETLTSKKRR